ncbi:MAG: exonuclease domain-containing protein [Coriobacteriia bacterium]|nr:exonuclease domain-containing protein [Coriobacteriia bacterium]
MLSGKLLADCEFVAVDLETTGCKPGRNSIIEVGAVRFRADCTISSFERLVRPTESIPRAVEDLTGITSGMVAHAPLVHEVLEEFRAYAHGAVLVAHNYRFDLSFLDYEAEELWGSPFQRPTIDTLSLARRLRPDLRRYSLGSLATELGTPTVPDHRAGNDARATAEILQTLIPDLLAIGITTVGDLASFCGLGRQGELAEHLRLTKGIPDEPGVYLFRDASGSVVFVGRAKSLRLRTRAYFYPGGGEDELACSVASITAVQMASPLDAALLERRLVDRHQPMYNPAAHRSRDVYLIRIDTASAYPGLRVVPAPRLRGRLIGPFTSRWAAQTLADRLTEIFGLRRCARRLDARLAATPCAYRDAGSCPAPCVTRPDTRDYGIRLAAALAVFDDDSTFRERLVRLQQDAAHDGRYEDAIRFRDAGRALDRALSVMRTVAGASARDLIMVEEHEEDVIVHLIRSGMRAAVLRGSRSGIEAKIAPAIERVYFNGAERPDPLRMAPERLGELLTVAQFEDADGHLEIAVSDLAGTVSAVRRSLGLDRRTPRRRHEAASGA